jgi:hypothetical protein
MKLTLLLELIVSSGLDGTGRLKSSSCLGVVIFVNSPANKLNLFKTFKFLYKAFPRWPLEVTKYNRTRVLYFDCI